jgi:hypothetical protein
MDDAARTALNTSPGWFKSSHSGEQNTCVELNVSIPDHPAIRDSKLGAASPILLLTPPALRAFLTATARGDFD